MQTKVIVEIVSVLVFCVSYLIATLSRSKINALFDEQERRTKIGINPEIYKYIAIMLFAVSIGCIAIGIIIGSMLF